MFLSGINAFFLTGIRSECRATFAGNPFRPIGPRLGIAVMSQGTGHGGLGGCALPFGDRGFQPSKAARNQLRVIWIMFLMICVCGLTSTTTKSKPLAYSEPIWR